MAKGNLFLGFGRGSVGDVVLYRANGQQIARARNRHPSNPQTDAQLVQRAIMATVGRAYAQGRVIFDHSFQGKKPGQENQSEFMSRNVDILRGIYYDGNRDMMAVTTPGSASTAVNGFRISNGTYPQSFFDVQLPSTAQCYNLLAVPAAPLNAQETAAQYISRVGLLPGDIYTLCAFAILPGQTITGFDPDSPQGLHGEVGFGFVRLTVKSAEQLGGIEPGTLAQSLTYGQLFDIDAQQGTPIPESTIMFNPATGDDVLPFGINIDQVVPSALAGALGVIRSRYDSDLRSSSIMTTPYDLTSEGFFGVNGTYLLDVWAPAYRNADPTLILEGSASLDGRVSR